MVSDGGKGSKARPISVSDEEYNSRWEATFGRADREQALDELFRANDQLELYDDVYETDSKDDEV
jgi:hypothetical protein